MICRARLCRAHVHANLHQEMAKCIYVLHIEVLCMGVNNKYCIVCYGHSRNNSREFQAVFVI